MASHPVESYLKDLAEIYRTGGGGAEDQECRSWTVSEGLVQGS